MGLDLEKATPSGDGAPEMPLPPELVEFVACELLRFTRDEDEAEVATRIIGEVLRQFGKSR